MRKQNNQVEKVSFNIKEKGILNVEYDKTFQKKSNILKIKT